MQKNSTLGVEQALLAQFPLYPGMTLREAASGFIANNRKRFDPDLLRFVAACAIVAGDEGLAATLLGHDMATGEALPPRR